MTVKDAVNTPPATVGARPYEMEGRREDRVPLIDFEDLSGWKVYCSNGADAGFIRSREQQMWGEYVGKLTYTGKTDEGTVILRPPAPVQIPESFDSINMWVYGNLWEWAPDPGTPFVNIAILIAGANGEEEAVPLVRVRWKEWFLAHTKTTARDSAKFTGIRITGINNSEPRTIFLDSLYFYKEKLKPLHFQPRPARNLTPFPGQDQGLNGTGEGKLPFPTREETILPTNFSVKFINKTLKAGKRRWEFIYEGKDCSMKYVYEPTDAGLDGISAYINDKLVSKPMSDGGIRFGDQIAAGKIKKATLKGRTLNLTFDLGSGQQAEYALRIWQKSLVIDFICRGGNATGLSLGEVRQVENPKLVLIPFLTFGGSNPRVLCSGKPEKPVFTSVWVDWYRSNGSELWSDPHAEGDWARINGGVRYNAKADGKRNDLYERVFLTVSPTFEETLPTIANPKSPRGKIAGERLWQESWGPENYAKEQERSKMLRSYGIDMLTKCNHEITWRDGGESFTLRTKAAPGKGGDKALKEFVAEQKALGWRSGLYTNYTDFAPVNEHWNEDYVQLTPEGHWRDAWPRNYALKPSRAVELDAKLAKQVQMKFGSNAAYTDVQTAVAPWNYCDYDARVPGAGTFAATFYAYGELLLNDQKVYGPVWSEGTYHWLYAGLATGNYGLAYTNVDLSKEPLNVAFDLMKIHPLECDIGMPWTAGFLKEAGWDKPERIDESIDHFMAATIAYGHIGWLVEEQHGIERTCRSYYMLQQLQKRYAMAQPASIRYFDRNNNELTASQAIASGVITDSRLRIRYRNGLEIHINGSNEPWEIIYSDVLPPWGWFASDSTGDLYEFSGLVDGHRVDYVRSPDYAYIDGRGIRTTYEGLSAKGAFVIRDYEYELDIIDIYGNDEIGFELEPNSLESCTAYDAEGKLLGKVETRYDADGFVYFKTMKGARRYVVALRLLAPSATCSIQW